MPIAKTNEDRITSRKALYDQIILYTRKSLLYFFFIYYQFKIKVWFKWPNVVAKNCPLLCLFASGFYTLFLNIKNTCHFNFPSSNVTPYGHYDQNYDHSLLMTTFDDFRWSKVANFLESSQNFLQNVLKRLTNF